MEDKIQIILEAVERAKAQIDQAIQQVNELNTANARSVIVGQQVKAVMIQQIAAAEQLAQKTFKLKAETYDLAQAEKAYHAANEVTISQTGRHVAAAGGLFSAITKNRIAFMEMGHVARATAEGLAFGISPTRVLAMELPRVIQAGALLGTGLATIGLSLAALIPLIITGAEAWKTYKARTEEAASGQAVLDQRTSLAGKNLQALNTALDKGIINIRDFLKIQTLLSLAGEGSEQAFAKAMKMLREIGIAPNQFESFEKLQKIEREMSEEAMSNFDKQRAKAADVFNERLKQIEQLSKESKLAEREAASARDLASKEYSGRLSLIGEEENKKKAADKLKDIEQDITADNLSHSELRIGQANKEFDYRVKTYRDLAQFEIITQDERTRLTLEAEKKRQDGLKHEAEEEKKIREQQRREEEQRIGLIEQQNRQLEDQLRDELDILAASKRRQDLITHPSGVHNAGLDAANGLSQIFDSNASRQRAAFQKNLLGLQGQGSKLTGEMSSMKAAPPGTYTEEDFAKLQTQIEENKRKQIQTAEDIKNAEVAINQQRMSGLSNMFAGMAQVAKGFGKEGFAAYKALSIAQATIDTARAAIAAYQSVVGIPYVGPILAPIAAAAAVAAGAAQIANIESQSFASGGLVRGSGTGTSDDVPINASNREFVVRNSVVEQPGALDFLRHFNERGMAAFDIAGGRQVVSATRTTSSSAALSRSVTEQARVSKEKRISIGIVETRNHLRKFMRQEGTKIVLDGFSEHGNQVAA